MKKAIVVLFSFFFIFSAFSWYIFHINNFNSFPVTDINQQFLFSESSQDNIFLEKIYQLNSKYYSIFGIRGAEIDNETNIYPTSFLGIIYLWYLVKQISPKLLFLINPFASVLMGFYLYKIMGNLITSEKYKNIGVLLFFLSAPIFLYSIIPYNNILSASVFIINLYFLIEIFKRPSKKNIIISSFLFGVQIWQRSVDIIFYLPFLFLFFEKKNMLIKYLSTILVGVLIFFIFLFPLLRINKNLYDNPLGCIDLGGGRGQRLSYFQSQDINNEIFYPEDNNWIRLAKTVNIKIFSLVGIFVVFAILGFISFLEKNKKNKKLGIAIFSIMLLQILYYGRKTWSGVDIKQSVADSFSRYILISWAVLTIFSAYFLENFNLKFKKKIIFLFCAVFFISNIFIAVYGWGGYISWLRTSQATSADKEFLIKQAPSDKIVIFTALYDKYFYPAAIPAIHVALPKEKRAIVVSDISKSLLKDGYKVYFIYDSVPELDLSFEDYFNQLNNNGLSLEAIRLMVANMPLYEINYID